MNKKLKQQIGMLKRKFKVQGDFEPGAMISKVKEFKELKAKKKQLTEKQVAIRGLV